MAVAGGIEVQERSDADHVLPVANYSGTISTLTADIDTLIQGTKDVRSAPALYASIKVCVAAVEQANLGLSQVVHQHNISTWFQDIPSVTVEEKRPKSMRRSLNAIIIGIVTNC